MVAVCSSDLCSSLFTSSGTLSLHRPPSPPAYFEDLSHHRPAIAHAALARPDTRWRQKHRLCFRRQLCAARNHPCPATPRPPRLAMHLLPHRLGSPFLASSSTPRPRPSAHRHTLFDSPFFGPLSLFPACPGHFGPALQKGPGDFALIAWSGCLRPYSQSHARARAPDAVSFQTRPRPLMSRHQLRYDAVDTTLVPSVIIVLLRCLARSPVPVPVPATLPDVDVAALWL
ncbi:hypothetical protein DFH09DRAFT_1373307 [Mycena vulgaris]|nr:hypothetical protein DFH09DRAFT_1373307 [Mycena vulgaris]